MEMPSYILAADNHNIGNTQTSWLDLDYWGQKFGNGGKLAASSILSGLNSFYNTAVTVGNWFGGSFQENDTASWISSIDSDIGQYYRGNAETADLGGFILGSLIPGLGGIKLLHAGQTALKTASRTGFLGGNLGKATGLLTPDSQKFITLAASEINASTTALKLLNANTAKALGAGLWQNTLEAAAFETLVQVTMFKSPVLDQQDLGDIASNIMIGGALGGVIGGAFQAASLRGTLKKAVKAEDELRLPFISRPSFAEVTSPSEKIISLSYDSSMAAVPVELKAADGTVIPNNFRVNKTLFDDKIRKNNNDIRSEIHKLTEGDGDIANLLADLSHPLPDQYNIAQTNFENFSGAVNITRVKELSKAEREAAKITKQGGVPKQIASRYVKILGESVGEVSTSEPIILSLGDLYKGQKGVLNKVREYGFDIKTEWNSLELKGVNAHLESEARHIWAHTVLKEIKDDTIINRFDIPLLERAYKDSQLKIKITSGTGPGLEVITPSSRQALWDLIKESKLVTANETLRKMSLDGSIPVEQGTAAAAKISNTKQSYLEGSPSQNEFDDLLAYQSHASGYSKMREERGLSTSVVEAIDPLFLPKFAKIVYGIDENVAAVTENVLDAIVYYKSKQKQYVDSAKNVVAKILGPLSESLLDISDTALIQANRVGSGAGLFSAENSNYGTIGSSMAWIGSIARSAQEKGRKVVGENLESSLIALKSKPEAAIEFESINQKISRSGKQWVRAVDDDRLLITKDLAEALKKGEGTALDDTNSIRVTQDETWNTITDHIKTSGSRTDSFKEIRAAQGHTDFKDVNVFRPIRPNLKAYPHFAFVKDPSVTGTGHTTMIHAASEKDLAGLIDKVPAQYKVVTKTDTEDFFKARGEYEYSRTLHENYIDSDLANKGIFSNFFPKSDPDKIVDDLLQQHYRESDLLVQETVRLRYEPQFNWLEDLGHQYSKIATSKFSSSREAIEKTTDNPYFNYIKTALNISKANEHGLIYGFNKILDESVSKAVGAVKQTFQGVNSPQELDKINALLDTYGMKPAYYDSALHVLANHSAPKGELTKFVRNANSLLSLFTLGLDPLNSLNNAIGSNILRMTELKHLTRAIAAGDTEIAGELGKISKIGVPGTDDSMLAPTKLVSQAIKNFWKDDGTLLGKYKADGYIKDRVEQLKLLVDDFTLKGTETVADLDQRISKGFAKAKDLAEKGEKLTGNKLAEEFNRFISANVMEQITEIGISKGLLSSAEAKSYINTFVNRVEGNIIASQRPLIFQGPVGQAIGLFQSYQFNLIQQLFRYVAEGSKKDLGMLLGLQSTLYGLQSLPGFQFVNTHILGQLSGNKEHRDAYDITYGAAGRTAGDFILYGLPSNLLKTNIYSRGDINPRQITILPTNMQEVPLVAGWGKFFGSMKETVSKISGGGDVWQSILQGVEHNGISRPLAGFAQVFQGVSTGEVYSTSSKGSILYSNDLMSLASLTRLAGGRPLDEAIKNDAMFRVKAYEAARRKDMEALNETVKTSLIGGGEASQEQVNKFAAKYTELGGKQAGFNRWMMGLYKSANVPQAQQLEMNLKNPFAYKMQLLMGGEEE